ncbi:MAG TPA: NlpC/P60 family protein [Hyphomicrobiaceae bacterium]|nr:NlpC/P60 family protein [Hyphomicrobiaceae bacterium]
MITSTRADVIAAARTWIGTPYHHQASLRGVGTDCLGLIRGVYEMIIDRAAPPLPAYSRDWSEATGGESMLEAARIHLIERDRGLALPGDILVFRMRSGAIAKHAAILATRSKIIHAMEGVAVAEVPLSPWWSRRIAGVFSYPGITA